MRTLFVSMPAAAGRPQFLRFLVLAGLAAVVIFCGVRAARCALYHTTGDWWVYYKAGTALRAGTALYNLDDGPLGTFKNAPCVALGMLPLTYLPPVCARLLSFGIDVVLLGCLLGLGARFLYPHGVAGPTGWWLAVGALALSLRYVMDQLIVGQTSCVWTALTVGAFLAMRKGRHGWAGICLAAAVCMKLVPLCFVPYFLFMKRGWTGLLSFTLTATVLLLGPGLWIGWQTNLELLREWPEHLVQTELPWQVWRVQNQSVYAQLSRFLSSTPNGCHLAELDQPTVRHLWLAVNASSLAAMYIFFWHSRRKANYPLRDATHLALLLLFMTLFNPHAWRYNFIALIFPYFLVLFAIAQKTGPTRWLIGLTALACIFNWMPVVPPPAPIVGTLASLGIRMWGCLLLGLAVVVVDRAARTQAVSLS